MSKCVACKCEIDPEIGCGCKPASSGTVEGVVGSLSERILRRIFRDRYEANRNEDPEMAVAHLMQRCTEIDLQLAAHRYALELQNLACGLPLDNEKYDKVADLLNDTRHALIEALNCIRVGEPPWEDDADRWRKIAGLDTVNDRALRSPASGDKQESVVGRKSRGDK